MAALPSYVVFSGNGFSEQRTEGGVLRTSMEVGPPKQRRLSKTRQNTRPMTLVIETLANYLAWVAWVRDDISGGNDWFTWTDPVDGVSKQGRIVGGNYSATPVNGSTTRWEIKFSLETWE